jgi:hypothetical protein
MGRVIRDKKNTKAFRKKRKLTPEKREFIEWRFSRSDRNPRGIAYLKMGRGVRCYLMPIQNRHSRLGDVIVRLRAIYYYAFLEEVDEEQLPNGERWYTFQFDCMSAEFVHSNINQMLQPGYDFSQMAGAANNCVIEFSLRQDKAQAIENVVRLQPGGRFQGLQEGTWWRLAELSVPQPYTVLATKYLPYRRSNDPTTIASACDEVATAISDIRIPRLDVLQALIRLSHPGELAERYPGR